VPHVIAEGTQPEGPAFELANTLPVFAGLRTGIRGWQPGGQQSACQFSPVTSFQEIDDVRLQYLLFCGGLLVAADASKHGRLHVWDVQSWRRLHSCEVCVMPAALLLVSLLSISTLWLQ